jgi:mannose-1-phosphate guanylyltransferase / mannose-6-phosphate isomerase
MTDESTVDMPEIKIIPLILCGGSGTRLWPLSRWDKPKQFLRLNGRHSLLESTLLRCQSDIFDTRPIIVGAQAHGTILHQTIRDIGVDGEIVLEPDRRDSCAAIVAGVLVATQRNPDALVMIMAADHEIPDAAAFARAAKTASAAAARGHVVTFGVKPLSPATGYGYILAGSSLTDSPVCHIKRFVEKPNLDTARHYVESGYLWNSGNFMFSAKALLEDVARLAPDIYAATSEAVAKASHVDEGLLLDKEAFAKSPRVSFDYAVMEKSSHAAVLPVGYAWSDIGSWDAVAEMSPKNADGNVSIGNVAIENSQNVFAHSEGVTTVVLGCNDISVIATPDAVLVVRKGQSENIKGVLDKLRAEGKFL